MPQDALRVPPERLAVIDTSNIADIIEMMDIPTGNLMSLIERPTP